MSLNCMNNVGDIIHLFSISTAFMFYSPLHLQRINENFYHTVDVRGMQSVVLALRNNIVHVL